MMSGARNNHNNCTVLQALMLAITGVIYVISQAAINSTRQYQTIMMSCAILNVFPGYLGTFTIKKTKRLKMVRNFQQLKISGSSQSPESF